MVSLDAAVQGASNLLGVGDGFISNEEVKILNTALGGQVTWFTGNWRRCTASCCGARGARRARLLSCDHGWEDE